MSSEKIMQRSPSAFDESVLRADSILKLRNASQLLKDVADQCDFSAGKLMRVVEHLSDARKSITAAVASMPKCHVVEPESGSRYAPGSGEYNDMMFGENPDY